MPTGGLCLIAPNYAIFLVAIPILRENPDIHNPELSCSRPLTSAIPVLPMELPPIFSFT